MPSLSHQRLQCFAPTCTSVARCINSLIQSFEACPVNKMGKYRPCQVMVRYMYISLQYYSHLLQHFCIKSSCPSNITITKSSRLHSHVQFFCTPVFCVHHFVFSTFFYITFYVNYFHSNSGMLYIENNAFKVHVCISIPISISVKFSIFAFRLFPL